MNDNTLVETLTKIKNGEFVSSKEYLGIAEALIEKYPSDSNEILELVGRLKKEVEKNPESTCGNLINGPFKDWMLGLGCKYFLKVER